MGNNIDTLTDDEVRQIALLVETLEKSSFDLLQLGVGNLKVTIGKGSVPSAVVPGVPVAALAVAAPVAPTPVPVPGAVVPMAAPVPAAPTMPAQTGSGAEADGTAVIVAPMMGRFYAKPEPGAAPFVSVGAQVIADSTVGLIEVMKVFTAVRAGVAGVITEICVLDAEFIEYGHVLFRVRPAAEPEPAGAKGSRKGARG